MWRLHSDVANQCLTLPGGHFGNVRYCSLKEFQNWTCTLSYFPCLHLNFHEIQNSYTHCSSLVNIKSSNLAMYNIKTHWSLLAYQSFFFVACDMKEVFQDKRFCNNYQQRQGGIILCCSLCISNYTLWNFIAHLNILCVIMIFKCWLLKIWLYNKLALWYFHIYSELMY